MTEWQQFLSQRKYEYWLLFWSHLHQMHKVWKVKNVSLILNVLMQEISTLFITKRAWRKMWGSRDAIFEVRYRMYINLTKKKREGGDIREKLVVYNLNYCGLYLQVERTFIKNKEFLYLQVWVWICSDCQKKQWSTKEKGERQIFTSMEQAWNGLYPVAGVDITILFTYKFTWYQYVYSSNVGY